MSKSRLASSFSTSSLAWASLRVSLGLMLSASSTSRCTQITRSRNVMASASAESFSSRSFAYASLSRACSSNSILWYSSARILNSASTSARLSRLLKRIGYCFACRDASASCAWSLSTRLTRSSSFLFMFASIVPISMRAMRTSFGSSSLRPPSQASTVPRSAVTSAILRVCISSRSMSERRISVRLLLLCLMDAQHRSSILRSSSSFAPATMCGGGMGRADRSWPASMSLLRRCATSWRRSAIMAVYCSMAADTLSTLRSIRIWMFLARLAYLRVLIDSSSARIEGLTLAIIVVRQLPPSESFRSRVSLLSLKGICCLLPLRSPSALMQLPRARRDRLILAPSSMR
mmetsp:Transcript_21408/g.66389  ORF Transcript_21408/g.66389 Transcript_21408/m.66389 type:complete len:347 (-) Transcript_21408:1106-2146(-)